MMTDSRLFFSPSEFQSLEQSSDTVFKPVCASASQGLILFVKAVAVVIAWTLSSFKEKMYQITHRILAGRMAHIS
jgi:hypothetical protein